MIPDEPDNYQLHIQIWRLLMPLTIASAMDVVAEVIRDMSLLPVTPPPPMGAPGPGYGVLALVGLRTFPLFVVSVVPLQLFVTLTNPYPCRPLIW